MIPEAPSLPQARAVAVITGLGIISTVIGLAGCGWTAPTGSIAGTVRFDGKPVAAGRLTVLCEGGGKPVFFADITDGTYSVAGAPVGAARVTVQAFAAQSATAPQPSLPGASASLPIPANVPRIGQPIAGFPERYLNPNTSRLRCEIKPGSQQQDFTLDP